MPGQERGGGRLASVAGGGERGKLRGGGHLPVSEEPVQGAGGEPRPGRAGEGGQAGVGRGRAYGVQGTTARPTQVLLMTDTEAAEWAAATAAGKI